jgi:FkbM family methyltransferase
LEPLTFADNNQRLWGKQVEGLRVISPEEAARQYGDSSCFVVTVYNGSSGRRQLAELGCRCVVPFAPLFWRYAEEFIPGSCLNLPHELRGLDDHIRQAYALLSDERSRQELVGQLRWRYWGDPRDLPLPDDSADTYFPFDLLEPSSAEVFVDCGGFDGDTLLRFGRRWGGTFRHAVALEPDPENRCALADQVVRAGMTDQVTVFPYAVGEQSGQISFASTGSVTSQRVMDDSAPRIECRRLDDIAWPQTPTYIKMDIEGAEPDALCGASRLLSTAHPVLAICTYHSSLHLWQIPNLIHSICPDYRLFLRRYAEDCWEGVCYAIPEGRLRKASVI